MFARLTAAAALMLAALAGGRAAAEDAELIFKKSTVFKLLTPNHKLATYAIGDPLVDGVACHFTVPEKGGVSGLFGVAEERSDVSLACPVSFKGKFEQDDGMFRQRRSPFFKTPRIVRGCGPGRNVLVYLSYSDKIIEGSPKNSTSTVPLMPRTISGGETAAPRCEEYPDE